MQRGIGSDDPCLRSRKPLGGDAFMVSMIFNIVKIFVFNPFELVRLDVDVSLMGTMNIT
jgi:hypothetical protein